MVVSDEIEQALSKAKIGLMIHSTTFFCTVAFGLRYQWSEDMPTACVDGVTIIINPTFFMAQDPDVRISIILHETLHCVLDHCGPLGRTGNRDPRIFNYAGDYVLNLFIKSCGLPVPDTWLCDDKFTDWSTNAVYDYLYKNAKKIKISTVGGKGGGLGDDVKPCSLPKDAYKAKMKEILVKAHTASKISDKDYGNLPGELQRALDKILNPKLPWDALLQQYMTAYKKDDYSFAKPNRRFMPEYIIPTPHSEALGDIYVAIDVSASVSQEMLTEFLSEVTYVYETLQPSKLTLHTFDTQIQDTYELHEDGDIRDIKITGGGGTAPEPVLEYIAKNSPMVSIIITDGYFGSNNVQVESDVIWCIYDNSKFTWPFGKVIEIEVDA